MRTKTSVTVGALALTFGFAGNAQAGTLEDVQARGTLNCVVSTGIAGFAYPDDAGEWHGFDIDFCRATAAAVLGDPKAIKAVTSTGKTRFTKLNAGEGDVLWRNTTVTFSRDVGVKLRFHGINYYDGQGFMTRKDLGVASAKDLGGASCVHPDRHHHRAQPRRLLPRQRHEVRGGDHRDQRRGAPELPRRAVRRVHHGRLRTRGDPLHLHRSGESRDSAGDHLQGAARPRHPPRRRSVVGHRDLGAERDDHGRGEGRDHGERRRDQRKPVRGAVSGVPAVAVPEEMPAPAPCPPFCGGLTKDPEVLRLLGADFAYNIIKSVGSYGELVERNIGERSIDFNFGSQGGGSERHRSPGITLPPPRLPFL